MILIDLVSAINHALPRLVIAAARSSTDDVFGASVGYAFFRPTRSGTIEHLVVDEAGVWSRLRASTVGILGAGTAGDAVARIVREQQAADLVCHHWVPTIESGFAVGTSSAAFADALAARVICVALPWTDALTSQVRNHRLESIDGRSLFVVWRRSPAFERALVHLGHRYVEPIQLCNLAAVACVSKFHLVRLFTATLGITPHRYQLLLRLARAKAMLRDGTCITQIAHGLGFADHSHLDRSFRILVGMTPSQYQRSAEP